MNDYWYVITSWNDDQGRQQQHIRYWANASQFSLEEVLATAADHQAEILRSVNTLDVPQDSPDKQMQYLDKNDRERLVRAVVCSLVPIGTWPNEPFSHHQPTNTARLPEESTRELINQRFGIEIWKLKEPLNVAQ